MLAISTNYEFLYFRQIASSELHRRRLERRDNIEEKIREIKRKQKEVEEGAATAKKRRSILISLAAGVTLAAVCIYIYTKI